MLSEAAAPATSDVLASIASLAHTLGEAQLRVLLALASKAQAPWWTVKASLTELRETTKCGRPNIVAAIAELSRRNIITTRPGNRSEKTAFMLNLTRPLVLKGGSVAEPPHAKGGSAVEPPNWFRSETTPPAGGSAVEPRGFATEPPPYKERAHAPRASIDSIKEREQDRSSVIDAILTAKPADHPAEELDFVRRNLTGYCAKFPPASWDGTGATPNATPPDDLIAAQILSVTSPRRFQELITLLASRRVTPGYEWSWWVTVVAQRCAGVKPETLAARRRGLRIERPPSPASGLPAEQQTLIEPEPEPEPERLNDADQFSQQIEQQLRKVKRL